MRRINAKAIKPKYFEKLRNNGLHLYMVDHNDKLLEIKNITSMVKSIYGRVYYPRSGTYADGYVKVDVATVKYISHNGKARSTSITPTGAFLNNYASYNFFVSNKSLEELSKAYDFMDTELQVGDMVFGEYNNLNFMGVIKSINYNTVDIKTVKKGTRTTSKSVITINSGRVIKITDKINLAKAMMLKLKIKSK